VGVSVYGINPVSGVLTEIAGSPFSPAGPEPSSIAIDPSGRFAYVSNQTTDVTYEFAVDAATGALQQIGTTNPMSGAAVTITIEPTGRFAYISDGLMYSIDQATGLLTQVSGAPYFAVKADPSGRFAYTPAAGIAGYSIDQATGLLTPLPGSPFGSMGPWSLTVTGVVQ
jgi:6-phosphogluconolactonase (cycloisomerase 2 family)